jgi:protein required for attachment to host cells
MKATRTWILIADGGRARILERMGKGQDVHAVPSCDFSNVSPPSHELGSDRPGRVHESQGQQRHAIEPRHDPHRALETLFAHQLADILEKHRTGGGFDDLVIVAPPAMLGDLRKALSAPLRAAVVGEIAKDLTKVPNHEIMRHLEADIVL